jgi:LysM domain
MAAPHKLMSSVKRESENGDRRLAGLGALAGILVLGLAACSRPGGPSDADVYVPPPALSLVAILDPSADRLPGELQQLQTVISANATPGEALVVMFLEPSFGAIYRVQQGDSLSKIAAGHGLSLSALEAANPQLGPLSGRDWKLIHPGERVMLPDGASHGALVLVSRAPAGPAPPTLIRLPVLPNNPTDFQRAQHKRTVDSDNATNAARIATWRAAAAKATEPWQRDVIAQLNEKAAANVPSPPAPNRGIVSASVNAGLTTLLGLNGRRVLLLLGGGDIGPAPMTAQSLADVNLVIANLTDLKATAAWNSAAASAGAASVSTLDAALTQLQLPQVINRPT